MDSLQEHIRQIFLESPEGVHSIFYANKIKNGIKTNEPSLVYFVEKKLPLNLIPKDQIIPNTITIADNTYKTDVVQSVKFSTNQCNELTATNVTYLQSKHRPLSGGLEISDLSTWVETAPYSFIFNIGTLGLIAVDNTDNTLVGLTNNHVVIKDAFNAAERNPTGVVDNIYEPIVFTSPFPNGFNGTFNPTILQGYTSFINDGIGRPKRYASISTDPLSANYLDAALITINSGVVDYISSSSQALMPNSYAMPFASSSEIASLSSGSIPVYSVGRTTGPKGTTCPLNVFGFGSTTISFNKQGVDTPIILSDVMGYEFTDQSNLPIFSGDSGSALFANFGGTNKIVALAFAGDTSDNPPTSTIGIASKIDNIASILNISAWDGSSKNHTSNTQGVISTIVRPTTDTRPSVSYNGKTYYQAGLILTTQEITNV
jgi:hypothetical protein